MTIRQWQPTIGRKERTAVCQVLEQGWLSEGPKTREFEELLAETVGRHFAIACSSGGSALFLALRAAKVTLGDEVIVPVYQQIALANAVALAGSSPIFVDVSPDDANILTEHVEHVIGDRTRAIVPVHMNGRIAEMTALKKIADTHDLPLIDDACQSLGSTCNGQMIGHTSFGSLASCFSFHPSKIITMGIGGAVVTDDEEFALQIQALKDYGRVERGTQDELPDCFTTWGLNFRISDVLAAIGLEQLKDLKRRVSRIRSLHDMYSKKIDSQFRLPLRDYDGFLPWCCDIRLKGNGHNVKLKVSLLEHFGIETRLPYRPLHMQRLYKDSAKGSFLGAELTYGSQLWLPTGMHLTDNQVDYIASAINKLCQEMMR